MTQNDSGTVYVLSSTFTNNFSSTFGAAIYIRSNAVIVKDSEFIENNSNEWVSFARSNISSAAYVTNNDTS